MLSQAQEDLLLRARNRHQWLPLALIVLGTLAALTGVGWGLWSLSLGIGTRPTAGTVIALERRTSAATGGKYRTTGTSYVPVVRYQVDGQTYSTKGIVAVEPAQYPVGHKVRVLYRTRQPAVAHIDSFMNRWFTPLIFSVLGVVFVVVGLAVRRQDTTQLIHTAHHGSF